MNASSGLICLLFAGLLAVTAPAQDTQPGPEKKAAAEAATTNASAATNTAPAVKSEVAGPASAPSITAESPALPAPDKKHPGGCVCAECRLRRLPPEIAAEEIRSALPAAERLLGTIRTDEVIQNIFARFCVGK